MSPSNLVKQQAKFTRCVVMLLDWIYTHDGWMVTFGEAYRPNWVQLICFEFQRSKTRYSQHTNRLAIDLNFFRNGIYVITTAGYKELGDYWKSLDSDCEWGGDWGWDGNHFQMKG